MSLGEGGLNTYTNKIKALIKSGGLIVYIIPINQETSQNAIYRINIIPYIPEIIHEKLKKEIRAYSREFYNIINENTFLIPATTHYSVS